MTPLHCAYGAEHKWTPTGVAMKIWTTYDIEIPAWCDVEDEMQCPMCGINKWTRRTKKEVADE